MRTLKTIAAACIAVGAASVAYADHQDYDFFRSDWSVAVPVGPVNSPAAEGCPIETADGLSLMFASTRPGGVGGNDIWVADRDSLGAAWQEPRNLGAPINSGAADFCPTPVGRSLYFVSERGAVAGAVGPVPCGGGDIYLSRQSPAGGWSAPALLKCAPEGPNFPGAERSPSLVETVFGTYLFYSSTGNGSTSDIYVSRLGADGNFGPGRVIAEISTEFDDIMPNVRQREDGSLEMVFSSNRPTWGRGQAAFGGQDVYVARAWRPTGPWSAPRNLGDAVNTAATEQRATLSRDGTRLYFGRSGDIFTSTRHWER